MLLADADWLSLDARQREQNNIVQTQMNVIPIVVNVILNAGICNVAPKWIEIGTTDKRSGSVPGRSGDEKLLAHPVSLWRYDSRFLILLINP